MRGLRRKGRHPGVTPADVADIRLYGAPDSQGRPCPMVLIEPHHPSGYLDSGIYVEYGVGVRHVKVHIDGEERHEPIDETLYPIQGRVLKTHPACRDVKPGDVVRFRPLNYTEAALQDGRELYFIDERALIVVIDGFDEAARALTPLTS